MQIDERRVPHCSIPAAGLVDGLRSDSTQPAHRGVYQEKFYLKRAWTDYPGLLCFNNPLLAWLGYRSPLAGLAHRLLYLFRKPFYDYEGEKVRLRAK
jgi:hypothetical protein